MVIIIVGSTTTSMWILIIISCVEAREIELTRSMDGEIKSVGAVPLEKYRS